MLTFAGLLPRRRWHRRGSTVSVYLLSISGQTLGGAERVPVAKGLGSGDADRGEGDDAPDGIQIREGGNLLSLDQGRERCHRSETTGHRSQPWPRDSDVD